MIFLIKTQCLLGKAFLKRKGTNSFKGMFLLIMRLLELFYLLGELVR